MKAMGIVFSNLYDSSLAELTGHRTVASLPFGGRYRQIDFMLSNFSNAGIFNVGVITKYNYRSLMDHLGNRSDWDLERKNEGLVILPPFASGHTGVYRGKLEALYSAVSFIDNPAYDTVILSDPTVVYSMDLRKALRFHEESGADVTVAVSTETSADDPDRRFPLVLRPSSDGTITELLTGAAAKENDLVGMGLFLISRRLLVDVILDSYTRGFVHFERDFLQRRFLRGELSVAPFCHEGIVLRNDSIRHYYENNLSLLNAGIRGKLFDDRAPVFTKVRDEIPAYYGPGGAASDALIADGCRLFGTVRQSILFRGVTVGAGAVIDRSIIMQGAVIGARARLSCVILDKNVTVSAGAELKGTPEHPVIIPKGETV